MPKPMPQPRSDGNRDWLVITATAVLVLSAQHYFQTLAGRSRVSAPAAISDDSSMRTAVPPQPLGSPIKISLNGWKHILWRTFERFGENRLLANAGGVVFFGLLAVFPAITALVSSYGLFADNSTIGANLQALSLMLPEGSFQIVQDQVGRVLAKGNAALGTTFLFGLLLAIWSANAGVKAVIDALNAAYEERETRSFIRLNLLSLAFTTGAIVALMLMVSAVIAFPLALDRVGLAPDTQAILGLIRWPLLLAVLLFALALLYRFGPSRPARPWRWLSVGATLAALLWIGGSALLSLYLSDFADYDATYGSLGAAIGFMMWMWMSASIVLLGAELNSEIECQAAGGAAVHPKPTEHTITG
jgi:membrane protein